MKNSTEHYTNKHCGLESDYKIQIDKISLLINFLILLYKLTTFL